MLETLTNPTKTHTSSPSENPDLQTLKKNLETIQEKLGNKMLESIISRINTGNSLGVAASQRIARRRGLAKDTPVVTKVFLDKSLEYCDPMLSPEEKPLPNEWVFDLQALRPVLLGLDTRERMDDPSGITILLAFSRAIRRGIPQPQYFGWSPVGTHGPIATEEKLPSRSHWLNLEACKTKIQETLAETKEKGLPSHSIHWDGSRNDILLGITPTWDGTEKTWNITTLDFGKYHKFVLPRKLIHKFTVEAQRLVEKMLLLQGNSLVPTPPTEEPIFLLTHHTEKPNHTYHWHGVFEYDKNAASQTLHQHLQETSQRTRILSAWTMPELERFLQILQTHEAPRPQG